MHPLAQGTTSSKKKKMAKLKRVMATVKRQERREKRDAGHNFAAIQLLHDPQVLLLGTSINTSCKAPVH